MSSNSWRKHKWYFVRETSTIDDIISWRPRHDVIKYAEVMIWCHQMCSRPPRTNDLMTSFAWRPRLDEWPYLYFVIKSCDVEATPGDANLGHYSMTSMQMMTSNMLACLPRLLFLNAYSVMDNQVYWKDDSFFLVPASHNLVYRCSDVTMKMTSCLLCETQPHEKLQEGREAFCHCFVYWKRRHLNKMDNLCAVTAMLQRSIGECSLQIHSWILYDVHL